jgi:hypothetical protein
VLARPSTGEPFRLRVVPVDEISCAEDLFACPPFGGARLAAGACVKRQVAGRKTYAELRAIEKATAARATALACRACEVGEAVAARLGVVLPSGLRRAS